jgi:ATP phosphoribosyltransferase
MPVALVFLPASDIPLYVAQGRVDIGITGIDIVAEKQVEVEELVRLGYVNKRDP